MASQLRRLYPEPAVATTPCDAYDAPRPPRSGDAGPRPWVSLCMIASLDGAVVVDGRSGPLGNTTDREVLLSLRELADVVLVGAGTARGEGYGPPRNRGLRVGVVTNSGAVDLSSGLFSSGAGFLIAPEAVDLDTGSVDVLRAGNHRVDLALALARLGSVVQGVRVVQAEGGPTLNAGLLEADAVDELNLTISPRMAGGDSPRVVRGAPAVDARFRLAHLLADEDGFLFGRWVRARESVTAGA
ncbi:MAG TPA: dihydrofolate reductase family protein [Ilumatobacter sp.]|nr:dihydrofolate reductase family protein [Ilumatobacter sp.]